MSVLFLFLPAWIGFLWVELLKIRGSFLRFLNAWVLGFVTMLSVRLHLCAGGVAP